MRERILKQVGVGLISGAVATAVMDGGQATIIPRASTWIGSLREASTADEPATPANDERPEGAPEKLARRFADFLDVSISRQRAQTLGNRLHWAYGTQWGVPYALLPLRSGPQSGLLYGAALWLGSDELLLWAIGAADKPTSYPLSTHLKALAAHVLYGLALGAMVRGLEAAVG